VSFLNGKFLLTTVALLTASSVFAQTATPQLIPDPSIGLINVYGQVNSPFVNLQSVTNGFNQISRDPEYRQPSRSRTGTTRVVSAVTRRAVETLTVLPTIGEAPGNGVCPSVGEVVEVVELNNPSPVQAVQNDNFPPLTSSFRAQGANCSRYIESDGSYGSLGQTIVASIRDRGEDSVFYSNDAQGFRSWCPNWQNLSNSEKEHFWVWTITAIAHAESTCRTGRISARGTNGTAVGPLQMELEAHLNRARASSEYPHRNCVGPSLRGPQPDLLGSHENNLRCGLDVLEKQLSQGTPLYRSGRSRDIYWQKLRRPNGGTIGTMIRQNPNCALE
tara:strand:+ start:2321 stop:3316 length:996 start_codon:yes stop_codon:yes gene_type:complete